VLVFNDEPTDILHTIPLRNIQNLKRDASSETKVAIYEFGKVRSTVHSTCIHSTGTRASFEQQNQPTVLELEEKASRAAFTSFLISELIALGPNALRPQAMDFSTGDVADSLDESEEEHKQERHKTQIHLPELKGKAKVSHVRYSGRQKPFDMSRSYTRSPESPKQESKTGRHSQHVSRHSNESFTPETHESQEKCFSVLQQEQIPVFFPIVGTEPPMPVQSFAEQPQTAMEDVCIPVSELGNVANNANTTNPTRPSSLVRCISPVSPISFTNSTSPQSATSPTPLDDFVENKLVTDDIYSLTDVEQRLIKELVSMQQIGVKLNLAADGRVYKGLKLRPTENNLGLMWQQARKKTILQVSVRDIVSVVKGVPPSVPLAVAKSFCVILAEGATVEKTIDEPIGPIIFCEVAVARQLGDVVAALQFLTHLSDSMDLVEEEGEPLVHGEIEEED
jgi:hypothetical protein